MNRPARPSLPPTDPAPGRATQRSLPPGEDHGNRRRVYEERRPSRPAAASTGRSAATATFVAFVLTTAAGGAVAWSSGCRPGKESSESEPRASAPPGPAKADAPAPSSSARASAAPSASAKAAASAAAAPEEKPYDGPLLGATAFQTPIYPSAEPSKTRLGYIRHGGKVPVLPTPLKSSSCAQGMYQLVDGGYVCGKWATTDLASPQVKLGVTAPNVDDVLPYRYAYNTAHGTPLYRSVPSKEDMAKYEPYLDGAKRKKAKQNDDGEVVVDDPAKAEARPASSTDETAAASAALLAADGGLPEPSADADAGEPTKPWWLEPPEPGKKPSVKLSDLEVESDSTIARRMVKGFFIAVDKQFGWNNRLWYKTTGGLVAPADRMYIAKPPTSQGIDFPEGVRQVGFVTNLKASKWRFEGEGGKTLAKAGPAPRTLAVGLTGVTKTHKTIVYRQTTEGWWMKAIDGTYTEPGAPPDGLAPGEKWIDVNLSRRTLVAFEGDRPVYAALVSPGKRSKNKEKDHATVKGTFRIREKHLAVTMDGDGPAGDLPYSIEDVPYVAYFEGSYALHGAFWHSNFGHDMSHGCVNLSPLDAKKIFFWSEPKLPRGWHGVWATKEKKGTTVVVHD